MGDNFASLMLLFATVSVILVGGLFWALIHSSRRGRDPRTLDSEERNER